MDCGRARSIPAVSNLNKVNPHGRARYVSFHHSIVHVHEEQAGAERTGGTQGRYAELTAITDGTAWDPWWQIPRRKHRDRLERGRKEGAVLPAHSRVCAVFPAGPVSPPLQLPLGTALVLTGVWQHHFFFVSYYGLNCAPLSPNSYVGVLTPTQDLRM